MTTPSEPVNRPEPKAGQVWRTEHGEEFVIADTYMDMFRLMYGSETITGGMLTIGTVDESDTYVGVWDGKFNVKGDELVSERDVPVSLLIGPVDGQRYAIDITVDGLMWRAADRFIVTGSNNEKDIAVLKDRTALSDCLSKELRGHLLKYFSRKDRVQENAQ